MMKIIFPWNELEVSVTRSSGAGGQHVNKTNSAVQLRFSISNSLVLSDFQKARIIKKLAHRLVQGDEVLIRCEEERDQKRNKETAFENMNRFILAKQSAGWSRASKSQVKQAAGVQYWNCLTFVREAGRRNDRPEQAVVWQKCLLLVGHTNSGRQSHRGDRRFRTSLAADDFRARSRQRCQVRADRRSSAQRT